jgi:Flp pilus assembly protein TadG
MNGGHMFIDVIRKFKNEKGQAFVELAIVLPLLLMILCGIIDYGWIFTNQNIIDHCAREGARYAIIHAEDSGAITEITNYTKALAPSNISNSLIITVTFTNSSPRLGDVKVKVNRDTEALTPIAGIFTAGQTINLTSSCTMKVE